MVFSPAKAALTPQTETFLVTSGDYTLSFNRQNGALNRISKNGGTILRGGEFGLWQMKLLDGTVINAKDFKAGDAVRPFTATVNAAQSELTLQYRGPEADVTVVIAEKEDFTEFRASTTPKRSNILDFSLPARLRFAPDDAQRLIFPMAGNTGTGWALKSGFFKKQNGASGWQQQVVGPQGYAQIFDGPLNQLADAVPPVALQTTAAGREWLGAELAQKLDAAQVMINRASKPEQINLILVNSPNGPWLAASTLGGRGALWRIANSRTGEDAALALSATAAIVEKLATQAPANRKKIGVIALQNGPALGGWTAVRIADWVSKFQNLRAVSNGQNFVTLQSPAEVRAALQSGEFLTILNPYGEWLPADDNENLSDVIRAIGAYVKAGGNWWEVGGYPFYLALRPLKYYSCAVAYPSGFADFTQLDSNAGNVALYGVQPQSLTPWIGAQDKSKIFVPGRLATGGDDNGGYVERNFSTFVPIGQTWTAPVVRLALGGAAEANLKTYAQVNNISRSLSNKVKPDVLNKLKGAVLIKYNGNAKDKMAHLTQLPANSLVHFSDYLKGGFDKEYPDHLPPHPTFGTAEDFKEFLRRCRAMGHLSMPYTNPTWWCDHPRGPTFQQYGEEPLLKDLTGKASYEKYGNPGNDGWTVTHWHPAVQAANRKIVQQFTEEYPVDILFQDQLGARTWHYDTNPASPTPYAYYDGMMSQGLEDSFKIPLGTEDGHDRVINDETQLCGMSWGMVPFQYAPEWRRLLRDQYAPSTWEWFPMAQILAHDKTAFYFHDLGAFVTNREILAYAQAFGFNMSYNIHANQLDQDKQREWLKWLDRVQKSVGAKTFGQPLARFKHTRDGYSGDGVVSAAYGDVAIEANLGPEPATIQRDALPLPPFGFRTTQTGLIAEGGEGSANYVAETSAAQTDLWVYAPAEGAVTVQFPPTPAGGRAVMPKTLTFDNQAAQDIQWQFPARTVTIHTPARAGQNRITPPADLANTAPLNWAQKPAIAVLDFATPINASWTKITPAQWINALQNSRLVREQGVPIKSIRTVNELFTALQAGPRAYLAIINPYPEVIPARAPGTWRETLGPLRNYINTGGIWWEMGGSSFYHELSLVNEDWHRQEVGGAGAAFIGFPVGDGEIEQPQDTLKVPARAKAWLGTDLTTQIEKAQSMVNRGLPRGGDDPGHFTIIGGEKADFLGGYRLNGWGWMLRFGGFWPNPDVAIPTTLKALEFLYTTPPQPAEGGGSSYLWHAVLK